MMKNKQILNVRWLLCLLPLLFSMTLMADETEIYYSENSDLVHANVLFLIDASGSMDETVTGDGRTRMQVLQDSFRAVMDAAPDNVNVGLMHYANQGLGDDYWWSSIKGVNFPNTWINEHVQPLISSYQSDDNLPNPDTGNDKTRAFLPDVVDSWVPEGYTPIVDSLYEAARYYKGDSVGWGYAMPKVRWAAHPLTYDNTVSCPASHPASCVKTWNECNGTETNCKTKSYNVCCNWIDSGAGDGSGYCQNNDYSCSTSLQTCTHTVCDTLAGAPVYKTPIEYKCQANYLVLMSDGKPEYPYYPGEGEADGTMYYPPSSSRYPGAAGYAADESGEIKPAIASQRAESYMGAASCVDSPFGYASGTCGAELTHYMATHDLNADLEGDQTVNTYAVAFAMADQPQAAHDYLNSLVTSDEGFFEANNADELAGAFQAILTSISKISSSFASPTYAVDQNTLLSHSDEVYIPVFERNNLPLWEGNLKKFKRDGSGQIIGKNDLPAVDSVGAFTDNAYDFWGTSASGSNTEQGGAASKLPAPASRHLYTDAVGTTLSALDKTNTAITSTMLGSTDVTNNNILNNTLVDANNDGYACSGAYTDCNGTLHTVVGNELTQDGCVNVAQVTTCPSISASQRDALLDFVRGIDKDGSTRQHMGDMLNSKPVIVDYGDSGKLIFAATNEGYLHAINTETGVEQWAFMPSSLLPNIKRFYDNDQVNQHVYGIDGSLTYWEYDHNQDGRINSADGDKRLLLFGLRRGGSVYYAMNITNPTTPSIEWRLKKPDSGTSALTELGETWSKLTLAKMRVATDGGGSSLKDVLVFGAGYDPAKDEADPTLRAADSKGRDVMIVDALSGSLVWSLRANVSGASSLLTNSIPGDIRVLDMDRNGALDRLYFADTGGNVWRVDMDHDLRDNDASMYDYSDARLTKFASLGNNGSNGTDVRKFFYEPDVALIQHDGQTLMTIALGSGYRPHPMGSNINDRFYVLMDHNVYNEPPTNFAALTNADLVNRTSLNASTTLLTGSYNGWYYAFSNSGEKVLASALTFVNKVIFTTFAPVDENGVGPTDDPCDTPPNSARAYVLDLFNGQAVANLNRSEDGSKDESIVAGANEILDSAQIVFREPTAADGSDCTAADCGQGVEIRVGKMNLPLMDDSNSNNASANLAEHTDLGDLLPRIFWLDHDVSSP